MTNFSFSCSYIPVTPEEEAAWNAISEKKDHKADVGDPPDKQGHIADVGPGFSPETRRAFLADVNAGRASGG